MEDIDFEALNNHFKHYSYICDYVPTQADNIVFEHLMKNVHFTLVNNHQYLLRWFKHMKTFGSSQRQCFKEISNNSTPSFSVFNNLLLRNITSSSMVQVSLSSSKEVSSFGFFLYSFCDCLIVSPGCML